MFVEFTIHGTCSVGNSELETQLGSSGFVSGTGDQSSDESDQWVTMTVSQWLA